MFYTREVWSPPLSTFHLKSYSAPPCLPFNKSDKKYSAQTSLLSHTPGHVALDDGEQSPGGGDWDDESPLHGRRSRSAREGGIRRDGDLPGALLLHRVWAGVDPPVQDPAPDRGHHLAREHLPARREQQHTEQLRTDTLANPSVRLSVCKIMFNVKFSIRKNSFSKLNP